MVLSLIGELCETIHLAGTVCCRGAGAIIRRIPIALVIEATVGVTIGRVSIATTRIAVRAACLLIIRRAVGGCALVVLILWARLVC